MIWSEILFWRVASGAHPAFNLWHREICELPPERRAQNVRPGPGTQPNRWEAITDLGAVIESGYDERVDECSNGAHPAFNLWHREICELPPERRAQNVRPGPGTQPHRWEAITDLGA